MSVDLVATYSMYYGPRGRHDEDHPVVQRGETFRVLATTQASSAESARHLIDNGVAVTPEVWAARIAKGRT